MQISAIFCHYFRHGDWVHLLFIVDKGKACLIFSNLHFLYSGFLSPSFSDIVFKKNTKITKWKDFVILSKRARYLGHTHAQESQGQVKFFLGLLGDSGKLNWFPQAFYVNVNTRVNHQRPGNTENLNENRRSQIQNQQAISTLELFSFAHDWGREELRGT